MARALINWLPLRNGTVMVTSGLGISAIATSAIAQIRAHRDRKTGEGDGITPGG